MVAFQVSSRAFELYHLVTHAEQPEPEVEDTFSDASDDAAPTETDEVTATSTAAGSSAATAASPSAAAVDLGDAPVGVTAEKPGTTDVTVTPTASAEAGRATGKQSGTPSNAGTRGTTVSSAGAAASVSDVVSNEAHAEACDRVATSPTAVVAVSDGTSVGGASVDGDTEGSDGEANGLSAATSAAGTEAHASVSVSPAIAKSIANDSSPSSTLRISTAVSIAGLPVAVKKEGDAKATNSMNISSSEDIPMADGSSPKHAALKVRFASVYCVGEIGESSATLGEVKSWGV